ncbi:MAG: amino acid racemase [Eubacteriales bacterium]
MKRLGVIGGLGPMATALYMKMIIEMTEAENDQEHIEMIIYNCPQIPDRTGYILGESQLNPVSKMLEIGQKLVKDGAELITFPCVTANYFYKELSEGIDVPMINMIEKVCDYLIEQNIQNVGLMATSGTITSGLFQDLFSKAGLKLIVPNEENQRNIMHVIYENVKANKPAEIQRFDKVARELRSNGAEIIILGCTELSVVKENCDIGTGYLDIMRLLARCTVQYCGKLKDIYAGSLTES